MLILVYEICNHTGWDCEIMWRKNKLLVHPSKGFNVFEMKLSTARIEVVPTVQHAFFSFSLIHNIASLLVILISESILCLIILHFHWIKVPKPT
jgi:hypothetical protein